MKILALNSSPRGSGQSKTEMMLNALAEGMREAGAEVEVVELRNKKVKNCVGCFSCWTKTPGTCIHKDDMSQELFPKWLESDFVVYASPLYHFTVNAVMKAFIERTLPILEPFFRQQNGRTYHPLRKKHPKVVILSVAGFPDEAVFDQLSSWVNFIYGRFQPDGKTLAAEIYRPMAEALAVPIEDFDQIAPPPPEGEQMARERILLQDFLGQQRQAVEAFAHVRDTTSQIDVHPGRYRDHRLPPSRAAASLARSVGSISSSTFRRRPLPRAISATGTRRRAAGAARGTSQPSRAACADIRPRARRRGAESPYRGTAARLGACRGHVPARPGRAPGLSRPRRTNGHRGNGSRAANATAPERRDHAPIGKTLNNRP